MLHALGLREKGFYTPYNYLGTVKDRDLYEDIDALFESRSGAFIEFLRLVDANQDRFLASREPPKPLAWDTRWISHLDGAVIYTAISHFRPARIIEVGSGNSTAFMCRAISDYLLDASVTCIDPQPRADISHLDVAFLRRTLAVDDVALLSSLELGDVLFIDSSHILQPGFDVDILLNRVFPKLKRGVIVHLHDIFLPFPYPESWAPHRFNEQNALMPWILSGGFEIEFASYYVWSKMKKELRGVCQKFPLDTPKNGGSLWLRKF
jgi:predicted O-methyltransferase YrrM